VNPIIKEEIIKSHYFEIDGPPSEEDINGYFRTRDKHVAIFLDARGFPILGWERVAQHDNRRKSREVMQFCFQGQGATDRAVLEYHALNQADRHNVNARCYNSAQRTITSIIQNPG
jgi:hypothetical protein